MHIPHLTRPGLHAPGEDHVLSVGEQDNHTDNRPTVDVDRVEVRGAQHTSVAAVTDATGLVSQGHAMISVDRFALAHRVQRLPWVGTAPVTRPWPNPRPVPTTPPAPRGAPPVPGRAAPAGPRALAPPTPRAPPPSAPPARCPGRTALPPGRARALRPCHLAPARLPKRSSRSPTAKPGSTEHPSLTARAGPIAGFD